MPNTACKIDMMTKVTLEFNFPGRPAVPFTLVYGVGSGGITPFEKALFGKTAGDRLSLEIPPGNDCEIFGHLERAIGEHLELPASRTVEIFITQVVQATDREIIAAMAAGTGCGNCDCGCGSH